MTPVFRAIEHIPTDGRRVVFCDGSAYHPDDGHPDPMIRYAAWCAADCRFEVREQAVELQAKGTMTRIAEDLAMQLALEFQPCKIISDYQQLAMRTDLAVPVEWVRRNCNRVADMLTHSPVGTGYLVFNSTKPERGWIDFIYD